jgi:hypothetical protein
MDQSMPMVTETERLLMAAIDVSSEFTAILALRISGIRQSEVLKGMG